jgi:hypothetical protein
LRLNRADVEQLRKTGICTESLRFGSGSQLTYTLETSSRFKVPEAQYRRGCIRVLLPLHMAQAWTGSDQISLSLNCPDSGGPSLLIEKDFQCLHGDEANPNDDADAFWKPSTRARSGQYFDA